MNEIKKGTAVILVAIVLFLSVMAILGIWDVISFENVMRKSLSSLFIIFVAAVIVLFIFSVLIKDNPQKKGKSGSKKTEQSPPTA